MAFNSNTYHANKSAKAAFEWIARAKDVKRRAAAGLAYDWEVERIATMVYYARSDIWTSPEDYDGEPSFPTPADFDPNRHTHVIKGRAVLNLAGIIKCLEASGVDIGLIQIIGGRLRNGAMGIMEERQARSRETSDKGIPLHGAVAFERGWQDKANPYPKDTVRRLEWIAEWHTANAAAFRDHVNSHAPE